MAPATTGRAGAPGTAGDTQRPGDAQRPGDPHGSGAKPSRPLFERFARLQAALPMVALADLPTPVRPLVRFGRELGAPSLWLKDDGASSADYGGNKVRKLELLLAEARARGAKAVLTFGYAGSNHATATAVHAARLGLQSISMLLPQQNAEYLRKNLLASSAAGAELLESPSRATRVAGAAVTLLRRRIRDGVQPYVIAPGGSSPLGTVGFVNAAFELAAQVEQGLLPMPEAIVAAGGSLGTVVGLGIGLRALGLATRVVCVRVVDEQFVNPVRAASLWRDTAALLRRMDSSFPDVGAPGDSIEFRGEWYGGVYARPTPESERAAARMLEDEDLALDITYTAKALSCLVGDAAGGRYTHSPVVFWNTCNTCDVRALASGRTPADLPRRLRRYFVETESGAR
jgi:1-aminocyclopropane-1-carboxylate deaminase/D-cysteine desulfhydrase-like pyridoxal-dependent ACC family enzyme